MGRRQVKWNQVCNLATSHVNRIAFWTSLDFPLPNRAARGYQSALVYAQFH